MFPKLKGKNILVTGGGGFLGFEICRQLSDLGSCVFSVSRSHYQKLTDQGVKQIQCDLSDQSDLSKKLNDFEFEFIIHTAAKAGVWGDFQDYYKANFLSTKNLLTYCQDKKIKNFIYTSSPSVVFGKESLKGVDESAPYPEKYLTHYAQTKAMAEKVVKSWGDQGLIKTIILRPHLIWGKGDPHILPRLLERANSGELKILGKGTNKVDIIHVTNAAHAHILSLKKLIDVEAYSEIFFIGQERPVILWDFIQDMIKTKLSEFEISKVSFELGYGIGYILESVYRLFSLKGEPKMTRFVALQLAKDHYFSHEKAVRELKYKTLVSIEDGLKLLT